ncbi:MAG TPA: hypothetical protein VGG16_22325 [Streptosporangiaceae bacterium]|jgi:hypothetical protein
MSEYEQDSSASTGRFRAFVEQAQVEDRATSSPAKSRGLLIGGGILVLVVIVVILAVALLSGSARTESA